MSVLIIASSSELAAHQDEQVRIRGIYGVQNLGGYTLKIKDAGGRWKRVNRIAFVRLEDEHYVVLEDRLDEEMEALNGQPVIATGKLYIPANSPPLPVAAKPASVPTLVEIISVESLVRKNG